MAELQRISFNPDPPVQGEEVEICYNFDGSGISSTTLEVTFTTASGSLLVSSHEVTAGGNCFKLGVPADAETILVHDEDGPSPDKAAIVETG